MAARDDGRTARLGPADHAVAGPLPAEVSAALTDWLTAKLGNR